MNSAISAVVSAVGDLGDSIVSGIVQILPTALTVMGVTLAVTILIGTFKKTAKK